MNIILNGYPLELEKMTVQQLLRQRMLLDKRVAVAIDEQLICRRQYEQKFLAENSRIDIIYAIGGA